jgi:YfiH family protein
VTPPFQTHELLALDGVSHGFFGRKGGVSSAQFKSLNAGLGSSDKDTNVAENRARIAQALGAEHLQSNYQIHSREIVVLDGPLSERPKADGMVTRVPRLALSALSADCGPVLLADAKARVIGACHAGWRGALSGITDATIDIMEAQGASRDNIVAVLGPCISQANYEVGEEFRDTFISERESYDRFFKSGPAKIGARTKPHFDLKAFILHRLRDASITQVAALPDCTYGQPSDYFSYRYNTHQGIVDYGRNISAIMLQE